MNFLTPSKTHSMIRKRLLLIALMSEDNCYFTESLLFRFVRPNCAKYFFTFCQ